MKFTTYILFSATLNKFYIGAISDDVNERIKNHNTNHKGFTGGYGDWELKYKEEFDTISEARRRELHIKKWKSRVRIQELIEKQKA